MDIGFERAGFDHRGFLEFDDQIAETLRYNRPGWQSLFDGDVLTAAKLMHPSDLGLAPGELSLLIGGPPCQPFSSAGQWSELGRRGMLDERANTVHALLDLVEKLQPRAVMLENVAGFVTGRNSALPVIQSRLETFRARRLAEYSIHWKVIDAADFGVPQHRRRVIVILMRDHLPWSFPEPQIEHRNAWDAIGQMDEKYPPPLKGKWADFLPSIPEGKNYQWLTSAGGGPEVFGYRTKYWHFLLKLSKNAPSWTLAATPGPSTGPFHWKNRPLSVSEAARIQSFPSEWKFVGTPRLQMKQIGNATPPLLAESLAIHLHKALDNSYSPPAPSLILPKLRDIPDPDPVQPLPKRYASAIGPKAAHAGVGLGPGALNASRTPQSQEEVL